MSRNIWPLALSRNNSDQVTIGIISISLRFWGIFPEFSLKKYFSFSTLKEILAALDDKLSNSDLDGIIAEIDTDGSGTVDFDGKFFLFKASSKNETINFSSFSEFMEMMTGD